MPRRSALHVGILFAALPWLAISCGTKTPTQPGQDQSLTAAAAPEQFLSSPQGESRELLIDGRPTAIEWNISGPPSFILLHGDQGGGGGDFFVAVRSVWSYDAHFGDPKAIYFLLQWPDPTASYLERPIVNDSVDIFDNAGNLLVDCRAGNDALIRPTSWHRSSIEEDQVVIEIFSDSLGSYPADNWRWGAGTTDPVFPSSSVEFQGSLTDGDTLGQTQHPAAGFAEDRYDVGTGPVDDVGQRTFVQNFVQYGNGYVPLRIASKGSRDTRLNRGKPTAYVIWSYVSAPLGACDSLNPIRVDDSGVRDKTWNPGDYVPSYRDTFPSQSQLSVLARGTWGSGKWNLELRRDLTSYDKRGSLNPSDWVPWSDDIPLTPGRRYMMRITVYDASSTRGSRSQLIPLYLKPR
jgi:hypothetical protein